MKLKLNERTGSYEVTECSAAITKSVNDFLRTLSLRSLSNCSVRSYGYDLIIIYRWLQKEGRTMRGLKGKELFEFIRNEKARGQKAKSINRRLIILRVYYRFLFDREIESGPGISSRAGHYKGAGSDFMGIIARVRRDQLQLKVKEDRLLIVPLKMTEVNAFLKEINRYRDLAMIGLMLFCGLRSCEVRWLEIDKINFEDRKITVMGKGARERMVPLTDQVIRLLRGYIELERPRNSISSKVFVVSKGKTRGQPLTAAGFRAVFRYRRKVSGVAQANPHRFRHTFGTNMAKSKMNLRILQEILGHAPGSPVTQQYLHIAMTDVAEAFYQASDAIKNKYAGI